MENDPKLHNAFLKFDPSTAVKQDFPYPSSIMYYIKTCQKEFEFYYKFVKTCKYFYSPTDPVPCFYLGNVVHLNPGQKLIIRVFTQIYHLLPDDLKKIKKIWLMGDFRVTPVSLPLRYYSCILNNLFLSNIHGLLISKQNISFNDFQLLISSKTLTKLSIVAGASVMDESDNTRVKLDKILECVPNIHSFTFDFPDAGTAKYVKKIMTLINPLKMNHFVLRNIIKPFDFETFSAFMKINPKILYQLNFSNDCPLPRECIQKLQAFVDEIIANGESENPPPQISFPGSNEEAQKTLKVLLKKYKNR